MLALENRVLRLFGPTNGPLTPYSTEMEWGQVIIFFAVACFAAIVLFYGL